MKPFDRMMPLIGDGMEKIKSKNVLVLGCGGVGSAAIEALVRSGITKITIVDNDIITITNLNRQIIALHSTLGEKKTLVMHKRILDINPDAQVTCFNEFISVDNLESLNIDTFDFIIDAIDTVSTKIALAEVCEKNNLNLISSLGTGNRLDPTKFIITDIYKTKDDPLARVMRYELRKRGVKTLKVLASTEIPKKINYEQHSNLKTDRKNAPASISFVPPVAGMIIASHVISEFIKE